MPATSFSFDKMFKPKYTFTELNLAATLMLAVFVLFAGTGNTQSTGTNGWQRLFNGKDLKDWETYLIPSVAAADQSPIGLNKDPHRVFSVVNGTMRISGQDWGGIMTKESYSNYHLRFAVKWGTQKWAPRENVVPDGGLLFHCSLPYDHGSKCWMRSVELQIQETDIGDYHNVGAGMPEIPASPAMDDNDAVDQYDPFAPLKRTSKRVFRSGNFESRPGAWTTAELVARGADAVFIVNGFVVNRIYNLYREDLQQQTTGGRIQFQSEGAEHFLKDIEIRPVPLVTKGAPQLVASEKELAFTPNQQQQLVITNKGADVELIAAELLGKNLEQWAVQLPRFPLVVKKGSSIMIPIHLKEGGSGNASALLRLETVLGPVRDFEVKLKQ